MITTIAPAERIHAGDTITTYTGKQHKVVRVTHLADKVRVNTESGEVLSFLARGRVTITKN